jgi:hypothetical protein
MVDLRKLKRELDEKLKAAKVQGSKLRRESTGFDVTASEKRRPSQS